MGRAASYHRLSAAAKQRAHIDRMREPGIRCPGCETETTAADLARHSAACPGPREPHAQSRWLTRGEALAMGVPDRTLHRWVDRRLVRAQGRPWRRRYLLRDLAARLAERRARRR